MPKNEKKSYGPPRKKAKKTVQSRVVEALEKAPKRLHEEAVVGEEMKAEGKRRVAAKELHKVRKKLKLYEAERKKDEAIERAEKRSKKKLAKLEREEGKIWEEKEAAKSKAKKARYRADPEREESKAWWEERQHETRQRQVKGSRRNRAIAAREAARKRRSLSSDVGKAGKEMETRRRKKEKEY